MKSEPNTMHRDDEQDRLLAQFFARQSLPPVAPQLAKTILADAERLAAGRRPRPGLVEFLNECWALVGGWRVLVPSAATGLALAVAVLSSNIDFGYADESVDVLSQAMLDGQYEDFVP